MIGSELTSALKSRPFLWFVLALPGLWIVWRWVFTPDAYGYGHAIGDTGDWAAWLLLVTLAVTPVRLLFRRQKWAQWLMKRRRDLGVASFGYALMHTVIYLWKKGSAELVLAELDQTFIVVGWLAFALFLPLAITSNDASMRALKRRWKTLHRLVYPAAILTFLHWVWSAFDPTTAWIHVGILAAIELIRIGIQLRQRVT